MMAIFEIINATDSLIQHIIVYYINVDKLSNRKDRTNFNYEHSFIHNLNNYFGELCHDKEYIAPSPLHITDDMKNVLPQLTLSQVFYA